MRAAAAAFVTSLLLAGAIQATGGDKKSATRPAIDPGVMKTLQRLEATAKKYPNITADVDYLVVMEEAGETEERAGKVYYQAGTDKTPATFRIHFDTLRQAGGPKIENVVDYVFDGCWLTIRKERTKQLIRIQVALPSKRINALQLGKGPFPVPFGQKAETVIEYFIPTTFAPKKDDPPKTDRLKLVPRKRHRRELTLTCIRMWVHKKTGLPVRIEARDRSDNVTTVIFKNTKTPRKFPNRTFNLPDPPRDWEVRVELLKGKVP